MTLVPLDDELTLIIDPQPHPIQARRFRPSAMVWLRRSLLPCYPRPDRGPELGRGKTIHRQDFRHSKQRREGADHIDGEPGIAFHRDVRFGHRQSLPIIRMANNAPNCGFVETSVSLSPSSGSTQPSLYSFLTCYFFFSLLEATKAFSGHRTEFRTIKGQSHFPG